MKSEIEKLSEEELEELYWEELDRFNRTQEALMEEDEKIGEVQSIELPTELRNDPNYLPF